MNIALTETILMMVTIAAGLILLYPLRRSPKSVDGSHRVQLAPLKRGLAAFPVGGDRSRQLLSLARELGIAMEGRTE
jgi:hypothetical protein